MQTPVTMEALAERLAMMGFVIAPHGDHIGLRLSLWTSVRVHVTDGRLSVDAHFGPLRRTMATVVKTLGLTALALASLVMPASPVPAAAAVVFLALALWGYDALRYTLTESCMTQVRLTYNALLAEASAGTLGSISMVPLPRALDAGQPVFSMQDLRVHTPVK
jgi:hypothetical protein